MKVARLDVQLRGCGDRGKAGGTTKVEEDKDAAVCRVSATRSQWSRPSILAAAADTTSIISHPEAGLHCAPLQPQLCTTLLAHRDIIQEKESVRRRKTYKRQHFLKRD